MNRYVRGLLIFVGSFWLASANAATVVFLSPGPASDGYWYAYTRFMQSAAEKLGMTLTVRYSERDTRTLLDGAREALQGLNRPDYLVFSNELNVAPEILRMSIGSGVKLFAVNNTLTPDQLRIMGDLSERYPELIGSLVGNDEEGGYLTAKQLISLHPPVAKGQVIEMLAFSGTNTTPVSLRREKGMYRALAEHPEVRLRQIVLGGWRRDRALEQARVLLKRYPNTGLIWAANDLMAFGAMDAVRELGLQPGKDVLFSTINWSPASLKARADGRISSVVGGHFMLGGLAMVMLHDYDLADRGTRKRLGAREARVMQLVDMRDMDRIRQASSLSDFGVDVRKFILSGGDALGEYAFERGKIVQ